MTGHSHKFDSQTLIVPDKDALADVTADLIVRAFKTILKSQPRLLFLPSSGRTPVKTYARLAQKYRTAVDWSRITVVQMDEYKSGTLAPGLYFRSFLQRHLIEPLNIQHFIAMTDHRSNQLMEPRAYDRKIAQAGTIDFALHGIGRNGHIGFNEPGSQATCKTRIVELAPKTRRDNFPDMAYESSPSQGMTLGLKTLARVKHTVLIASGEKKAEAIARLISKSPISDTPACALFNSADFGIIADRSAAKNVLEPPLPMLKALRLAGRNVPA